MKKRVRGRIVDKDQKNRRSLDDRSLLYYNIYTQFRCLILNFIYLTHIKYIYSHVIE